MRGWMGLSQEEDATKLGLHETCNVKNFKPEEDLGFLQ
jgi:hypothetical protein